MKKVLCLLLVVVLALGLFAGCGPKDVEKEDKIAMVTDVGDITDQSFNQTTWEATKAYGEKNNIPTTYYRPTADTTESRVEKIEQAIQEGATVVVCPGFLFEEAVGEVQDIYPDTKFIVLDTAPKKISPNTYGILFQEEEAGYLAGYAAVMNGERNLGFLGGMAVPAVIRFGLGYVQGIVDASNEVNENVNLWYGYGGQFFGDADITAAMDTWMASGCETIFASGGGIFTSVVEAVNNAGGKGKLIGVDSDQSLTIKDCEVLTSAFKDLGGAVNTALDIYFAGKWDTVGGKVETFGLKTDETKDFVGLPRATWSMTKYTLADYDKTLAAIRDGSVTISNKEDAKVEDLASKGKVTVKVNVESIK